MRVSGYESIASLLENESYQFKLIANESGVILFPCSVEHRDAGSGAIVYADDYKGNALAAMVAPGKVEFRLHKSFSDERVRILAVKMLALPELQFAAKFAVTYQGRTLIAGSVDEHSCTDD